jgi:ketosteroid isomerase-like protein
MSRWRSRPSWTEALVTLGLGAFVLGGGCGKDRTQELEQLRSAIEAQNIQFAEAFARRDVAAIGRLYTADAQAYPPSVAPVAGRAAIQDMWKGFLAHPVGRIQLRTDEVDGNGTTAWESGRYTLLGNNGATMDDGKYIVVWKREADGWKLYRDMWSSDSPQLGSTEENPATGP